MSANDCESLQTIRVPDSSSSSKGVECHHRGRKQAVLRPEYVTHFDGTDSHCDQFTVIIHIFTYHIYVDATVNTMSLNASRQCGKS
jgi:hypothetical protein